MAGVSKRILQSFDAYFKDFADKMNLRKKAFDDQQNKFETNVDSSISFKDFIDKMNPSQDYFHQPLFDPLFGQQSKVDAPLPKISDLESFRNTSNFKIVRENSTNEIIEKLRKDMNVNVKAGDPLIDDQVAEMYDTDIFGSFSTDEMWEDFSLKEIRSMVDEIKGKGLGGNEVYDYFRILGNADGNALSFIKELIE